MALAAGAIAAVAVASLAAAQADNGGTPARGRSNGPAGAISAWLNNSNRHFQVLMARLVERSARLQGSGDADFPPAGSSMPDVDAPFPDPPASSFEEARPRAGAEEAQPRDGAGEVRPRRERPWHERKRAAAGPVEEARWPEGGEARAGRHGPALQASVWRTYRPEDRPPRYRHRRDDDRRSYPPRYCRNAGRVINGWYIVGEGDTLSRIAERFYGDSNAWRRILRANWRTLWDADYILTCQCLYLPPRGRCYRCNRDY
jgi:nucleoid-associated protein YgaU